MLDLIAMDGCSHLLDQRCATHAWHLTGKCIMKVEFFKVMYSDVLEPIGFLLKFPKL